MSPELVESLFSRLETVSRELRGLYVEEAQAHTAERQQKSAAWMASQSSAASARDREADSAALSHTMELFTIRGDIRALEEERDHIMFTIQYRRNA